MTRRPLLGPALGFLAGAALGASGVRCPPLATPAALLAFSPATAPVAFGVAGWLAADLTRVPPNGGSSPAQEDVEGSVVSVPEAAPGPVPGRDRARFLLRARDGRLLEVVAPRAAWPLAPGDAVRVRARTRAPFPAANPGGRDRAARLSASGVSLEGVATLPPARVAAPSPLALLERARERLAEAAGALPPRERGVVRAIGTGDRGALDPATAESFARSGLAHVLAVSGLHLVVVAYGLERLVRALLLRSDAIAARVDPRRLSAAAAIPATALYAVATGAGAPVLRAAIAAGAAFAGALADREPDALNTLALAALALAAADPGALLDPSLQLSLAAVAGLALWAAPLRRALPVPRARPGTWRARLVEPLLSGACATLAASVATAPVLALHFRRLPLLGVLANVVGVPLGSALTAASAAAAVAASAAPALAAPLVRAARPLATALLALSDAAAAPRWGVLWVGSPGAAGALAAGGLLVAAGIPGRRLRRIACAAGAVAALLGPPRLRALAARARGGVEVTFLSVGQGDAAVVRLPDGRAALVDAGGAPWSGGYDPGARDVLPYLLDLGVRRVSALFVSHAHADHLGGAAAIAAALPVDAVYVPGPPADAPARAALARLPRATVLAPGARVDLGEARIEIAGGPREGLGENDASLVLRLVHGGVAFLFPGDVEEAGEAAAVAAGGLAADVVKVPHHGSRHSSGADLVRATGARWAVASAGRGNRFGFPHSEALARWRAAGAVVLRTDEGAVRFVSGGRAVRLVPAADALAPLATWRERP